MITHYKNPWHNPRLSHYGPEFYTTDETPEEYRGYLIYNRTPCVWDVVKDGACVTQMAGPNGARQAIDKLCDQSAERAV